VPFGSTQATQIPVKCAYLKSLLCAYYNTSSVETDITKRVCPFDNAGQTGYYHFMIGGTQHPQ
jgi:hypothetical protein